MSDARRGTILAIAVAALHLAILAIDSDTAMAAIDLLVPVAALDRPLELGAALVIAIGAAIAAAGLRQRRRG